jgi:hypothetical protein
MDGKKWDVLFFDLFHPRRSNRCPEGYFLTPYNEAIDRLHRAQEECSVDELARKGLLLALSRQLQSGLVARRIAVHRSGQVLGPRNGGDC